MSFAFILQAMAPSYSAALRTELTARARIYAEKHKLPYIESYGREPIICFPAGAAGHGNFLSQTYRAILANAAWRDRLQKPHTSAKSAFPRGDYRWRELDSCVSSDALLMNLFCFPTLLTRPSILSLLGIDGPVIPQFGVKARVPFANSRFDRTEIDLTLGQLYVEAKLSEPDFQQKSIAVLETYRDFHRVFEWRSLPRAGQCCCGYQLIRNVLAAFATGSRFCVMLDARRPDLLELWYRVMSCVRESELRVRCQVLTWQELAVVLPRTLQRFLDEKYGILPRNR